MSKITSFILLAVACMPVHATTYLPSNCSETVCKFFVTLDEPGFYIFTNSLDGDAVSGLWDFSLSQEQGSLADSTLYFGGKLATDEVNTAYLSFYLDEAKSLGIRAKDFTQQVQQLRIKLFKQYDSQAGKGPAFPARRVLRFQADLISGDRIETAELDRGHYLLTVASNEAGIEGKVGATIYGLKTDQHVSIGGTLANSTEMGQVDGYLGKTLDAGNYVVRMRFGGAKTPEVCQAGSPCPGASRPELLVKKTAPGGIKDILTRSQVVSAITEHDADSPVQITPIDFSDDGQLLAFGTIDRPNNITKVSVFDQSAGVIKDILVEDNSQYETEITALAVSGDGTKVGLATFTFDPGFPGDFRAVKVNVFDAATESMVTVFQPGCGSNCLDIGPVQNISFDATGQFLMIEPFFDHLRLVDVSSGTFEIINDLDFMDVQDMTLSADGSFLVFSSSTTDLVADDENGDFDVFIKDLQTGTIRLISRTADMAQINGDNRNPVLGFDNDMILFSSNKGPQIALYLYDVALGYAVKVTDIGDHSQYAFAPDAQQILFTSSLDLSAPRASESMRLWSHDLLNGRSQLKTTSQAGSIHHPFINQSGEMVVFVVEQQTNQGIGSQILQIEQQREHSLLQVD